MGTVSPHRAANWIVWIRVIASVGCLSLSTLAHGQVPRYQPFPPGVFLTSGYSDNVLRDDANPMRGLHFTATPALLTGVTALGYRFRTYVGYRGHYTVYQDFPSRTYNEHYLTTHATFKPSPKYELNVDAGRKNGYEKWQAPGEPIWSTLSSSLPVQPITWTRDEGELALTLGEDATRGQIGVRFKFNRWGFDHPTQQWRDRITQSGQGTFKLQIGGDSQLVFASRLDYADYNANMNSRDHIHSITSAGFDWGMTEKTNASWRTGLQIRRYLQTSNQFTGLYANISAHWALRSYSILGFSVKRTLNEHYNPAIPYQLTNTYKVSWKHKLSPRIGFDTYGKYEAREYTNAYNETYIESRASLTYSPRRWFHMRLSYEYNNRRIDPSGFTYTANNVLFTIAGAIERVVNY